MEARFEEPSGLGRLLIDLSDSAIIVADAAGTIRLWNTQAERTFGWTTAEAAGRPLTLIVPVERTDEAESLQRRLVAGEIIKGFETIRQRRDGELVAVAISGAARRSPAGAVEALLLVLRDVSSHEREQRAARRLAAIVESSDDAIVSKDLNGFVQTWNSAAERMFGWSAAEMIGRSIRTIVPADRQDEEEEVLRRIRRGDRLDHFQTLRQRKDGSLIDISLTVSPILDDAGTVIGASKIARDISELTQAELERQRLLAESQENAAVAEKLNAVGATVSSGLDHERIAQTVTDAATGLTGAAFGALFFRIADEEGTACVLSTVSGLPRERYASLPMPQPADVVGTGFGSGAIRSDDVTADPRFDRRGEVAPGNPMVRSYLAVPLRTRAGEVLGTLCFGHGDARRFSERHERLAIGIASWASVALENARLYVSVQEASRLKDEFLASLSHELRTPLNAILGYSQMLRKGTLSAEHRGRALETIERNAESLAQIVDDVLDVSRIVVGKMRLNVQLVDVDRVFRDAIDAVLPAAEAKGIQLDLQVSAGVPALSGDPARLQQILWNLLSNAVKFTNRGGRIEARLEGTADAVHLVVRDNGIGIAPAFLPFIFERFRQADGGTSRERGGLGLGLSIARQLVEMHGGTIQVASEGIGAGTEFRIVLPVTPVPAASPASL